jgi:hypothetical protein
MPIFITNEAQIVLTYHVQKRYKLIPGALKWIFWRYLTSNAPPWFILLHINRLTICALFSKFLLVRIPDTQRAQTGLISNSWGKCSHVHVVFEIQNFSAIPRIDCHPSRSITSWTSFLQRCHLRNSVFLQDHPLNWPFYPKIFYNATFTLRTTHVTMFSRLIKGAAPRFFWWMLICFNNY